MKRPFHLSLALLPCMVAAAVSSAPCLQAQPAVASHTLTLSNGVESIDKQGRRVVVANVTGDLSGVLTLALVVSQNGSISGGEWALNVSYLHLSAASDSADGDQVETLVQRGVLKGRVVNGSAVLNGVGIPASLSAVHLDVTGATLEFSTVKAGSGSVTANDMDQPKATSGTLVLTY